MRSPPKPGAAILARAALLAAIAACSRGEPPTLVAAESASVSLLPPPPPRPAPSASASAAPSAAPVDPGTLPQTHDQPADDSDALRARGEALFEAIQNDDPDRGMTAFFPKTAYEQVKAIPNPASDWRYRLVANYKRDIHAAHAKLGRNSTEARFVSLDVGPGARWVQPGEEGNKLGYFRVYGTKLRYSVDGHERNVDISSMISWRGEWYVVHLSGFT
ncbi:MAG TPA: hypothetical protein VGH28_14150 [Polyangiaceae bacterium]|jgi:hypothetical protein